jgi:hypothetical protein
VTPCSIRKGEERRKKKKFYIYLDVTHTIHHNTGANWANKVAIYGKIANYASCGYHLPIIGWSNPAICCTFIASYSTASKTYKLVGCKHDVNHKTTLGLAVKMLEIWVCHTKHKRSIKKLGLSYKRSEIDMVLACNRALLHHMCLGFSAIQPYRSGLQVQIF